MCFVFHREIKPFEALVKLNSGGYEMGEQCILMGIARIVIRYLAYPV
jgi:hypothetical protein